MSGSGVRFGRPAVETPVARAGVAHSPSGCAARKASPSQSSEHVAFNGQQIVEETLSERTLPHPDGDRPERLNGPQSAGFDLGKAKHPDEAREIAESEGIIGRRVLAYAIDVVLLLMIWPLALVFSAMSLFTLTPVLFAVIPVLPLLYHTGMIASSAQGTLGMRALGIKVVREIDGNRPDPLQAFILTALFYLTLMTSGLLLLWCLFDDRSRCLHDILSGTKIVRG